MNTNVLSEHRGPYLGFAWDHPLRVHWREEHSYDPAMCEHPWTYAFRDSSFKSLAITFAVVAVIFLPLALYMFGAPGLKAYAVIAMLIACLGPLSSLNAERWRLRSNKSEFQSETAQLVGAMGLSLREAAGHGESRDLSERATTVLLDAAKTLREAEMRFSNPGAEERVRTKKEFDQRYQLFLRWGLIEDTGYGPYFPDTPPKK